MNKHPQRLLVGTTVGVTDGAAVGKTVGATDGAAVGTTY